MLAWKNTQWAAPEKILAIIFEAGFITPADLQWVSGLSDRTLRRAIQKLAAQHAEPPVQRYRWNSSRVAYYLSATGVKMAHSIHGITAKPIVAQGQVSHALGLNGILFRYVRTHPDKPLRWYTTRDATETLLYLRGQVTGKEEGLLRKTLVHPDAIWQLPQSFWWVEFDNETENHYQLTRKYRMYAYNLQPLDPSLQRVMWVTRSVTRCRKMKDLWEKLELNTPQMRFYVEGQEKFSGQKIRLP